jgi:hypothetical protein
LGYVKQSMVRDDEPGRDRSKRLEKMEFHAGTRTTGGAGPNGASADWNPCFLSSAIADWGKVADQITSRLPLPKAMQQVRLNRRVGRFPVHNVQHLMVGRFRGVPLRHEIAFQAVFRPEQKPVAAERILKPPPEVFASVGRLLPFLLRMRGDGGPYRTHRHPWHIRHDQAGAMSRAACSCVLEGQRARIADASVHPTGTAPAHG